AATLRFGRWTGCNSRQRRKSQRRERPCAWTCRRRSNMFACLFGDSPRLAELAGQFSPSIQKIDAQTVAFSIAGLGALFGDAHQVAAEIARRGADMGVTANLAIAANLSAAILAARNLAGTTIPSRGKES